MESVEIRAYLGRDWEFVRAHKDRYWSERKQRLTPDAALGIAEGLREHVRDLRPEWPDAAERKADIQVHTRVSECLRRVLSSRG